MIVAYLNFSKHNADTHHNVGLEGALSVVIKWRGLQYISSKSDLSI